MATLTFWFIIQDRYIWGRANYSFFLYIHLDQTNILTPFWRKLKQLYILTPFYTNLEFNLDLQSPVTWENFKSHSKTKWIIYNPVFIYLFNFFLTPLNFDSLCNPIGLYRVIWGLYFKLPKGAKVAPLRSWKSTSSSILYIKMKLSPFLSLLYRDVNSFALNAYMINRFAQMRSFVLVRLKKAVMIHNAIPVCVKVSIQSENNSHFLWGLKFKVIETITRDKLLLPDRNTSRYFGRTTVCLLVQSVCIQSTRR